MELTDLITIFLFIIPGWISLYLIHIIIGYEYPKNSFDKLVVYVFHNAIPISFLWSFHTFILKKGFTYGIENFVQIIPFAVLWGILFSFLSWLINKFNLLPNGLMFNSNIIREINRKWFADGYVRVKLKTGTLLKGWIYSTQYSGEDNKYYLALAKYKRLVEYTHNKKLKYREVSRPSNYQIALIDYDNVDYIEYSHKRMRDVINKKLSKN